ncbi:MAG TPA: hypothetical protein VEC19_12190 [Usitatibacter sp.]|nr:hypothetical protein [Usitatibacter sp.]
MGLFGKLIAGKLVAKAMRKMKEKDAAAEAAARTQYIPRGAPVPPRPSGNAVVDRAASFYQRNPKLVAAAGSLLLAALTAALSKRRRLH